MQAREQSARAQADPTVPSVGDHIYLKETDEYLGKVVSAGPYVARFEGPGQARYGNVTNIEKHENTYIGPEPKEEAEPTP